MKAEQVVDSPLPAEGGISRPPLPHGPGQDTLAAGPAPMPPRWSEVRARPGAGASGDYRKGTGAGI